jgi:hypothetical protein
MGPLLPFRDFFRISRSRPRVLARGRPERTRGYSRGRRASSRGCALAARLGGRGARLDSRGLCEQGADQSTTRRCNTWEAARGLTRGILTNAPYSSPEGPPGIQLALLLAAEWPMTGKARRGPIVTIILDPGLGHLSAECGLLTPPSTTDVSHQADRKGGLFTRTSHPCFRRLVVSAIRLARALQSTNGSIEGASARRAPHRGVCCEAEQETQTMQTNRVLTLRSLLTAGLRH